MRLRAHVGQAFFHRNLEDINSAISIRLSQVNAVFEYSQIPHQAVKKS